MHRHQASRGPLAATTQLAACGEVLASCAAPQSSVNEQNVHAAYQRTGRGKFERMCVYLATLCSMLSIACLGRTLHYFFRPRPIFAILRCSWELLRFSGAFEGCFATVECLSWRAHCTIACSAKPQLRKPLFTAPICSHRHVMLKVRVTVLLCNTWSKHVARCSGGRFSSRWHCRVGRDRLVWK